MTEREALAQAVELGAFIDAVRAVIGLDPIPDHHVVAKLARSATRTRPSEEGGGRPETARQVA